MPIEAPINLELVGVTDDEITVTWEDTSGGVAWHRIYFRVEVTDVYEIGAEVPPGTFTVAVGGLFAGTPYELRATAFLDATDEQESAFSGALLVTTTGAPPPPPPEPPDPEPPPEPPDPEAPEGEGVGRMAIRGTWWELEIRGVMGPTGSIRIGRVELELEDATESEVEQ